MAFTEFRGKLDKPAGTGFAPFSGKLDAPLDQPEQSLPEPVDTAPPRSMTAEQYKAAVEKRKQESPVRSISDAVLDTGITLLKGAIGLPESFVGLAGLPSQGALGKFLEKNGYRPREAKEILDTYLSEAQQAANRKVRETKGFLPTIQAALENPSTIATTVGESVPQMLGGAAIARTLLKAAPAVAPFIAGAIGEGALGAGSAAEQIRGTTKDKLLTPKQAIAAAGSGAGTALFGAVGGRLAQKLGLADIDTLLAAGPTGGASKSVLDFTKKVLGSGISEGVFEEMPQSVQETMWMNYATDKPLLEGVPEAAAMGAITGFTMGVGGGGVNAALQRAPAPVDVTATAPLSGEVPPVDESTVTAAPAPATPKPGDQVELDSAPAPAPPVLETVPGMTQDTDLAQEENVSVTPVTPVLTEAPTKAKWLKAINDQNRMQPEGGVQLTVTPEGKLNFMGDPNATKQGKALEATLNEAIKAGATVAEIAESINSAKQPAAVTPETTAPVTTVKPTLAAASLPETPTVPPAKTPKLFEPAPDQNALVGLPTVEVPLKDIQLSKDLPQFKVGANVKGVVEPLAGKFERTGVAPIQLWKRLDGSLEVISGRHRFDLAGRSGETTIPAQIHYESQGFDLDKATILDSELNIRDGQGKVKDYVDYFKNSKITREEANGKGLLARALGKRAYGIATQGEEELIAAIRNDQINDEAAYNITINAPNDARLQSVGLRAIMDGKSMQTATNTMQAVKAMAAERDTTTDMFGFDDSLIKEAQEMAKIASKMQKSIQDRLSAITGAAKNPAMAKTEGIDVRDPEAVKLRIEELRAQKAALENWSTSPELVAEIRAARGVEAPQFELKSETPQETVARESTQDADRRAAEQKKQADNEVDFFELQPSTQETSEAPTEDMFAGEAGPSAEFAAARELRNRANNAFIKAQEAMLNGEISGEDLDAYRKAYDKAVANFEKVQKKEQGQEQADIEEEGSAEYRAASELANRASAAFRKVQEAYRKQEIGDEDFLAGRKVYDAAMATFDKAFKKEQGRGQAEIDEQESDAYEALQKQAEDEVDAGPIGKALQRIEDGDFETKAQVRSFVNKLEKDGILDDVEDAREGLSDREQSADDVLDTVRSLLDDARDDAVQERLDELESEQTEDVKDEKEFIEETTKDKLEAITQDFMVGDMVRFGSIPGTVVGVEGNYVRMRPDAATAAKAYQRVPKTSLTFVGRPDTTSMVSYSKEQDNKFGEEAGQLNANMGNLIQLLGANMYSSSLAEVTVKELLQNAFDAVKGAVANTNSKGEKIQSLYKTGKVQITINSDDRTISISDDARGMTPQIVRDAFFTVAGSDKSDLPPGQRSGGLGLAKMGFMLGAQNLKLDTVRDGVRVTVDTSSVDIANNNFKILKSPAPKGEHGTTVTVKIPEFYIDPKNGEERSIYFPYSLTSIKPLNQPLIGPVEVSFKNDSDDNLVLPVGINFADKDYNKFKANFDWGSADIFFGIQRKQNKYDINHKVLSAGVYQFSPDFSLDNEKIPYDIVVNIAPNVDARHPDYPFVNSRESFKTRIKQDVEALTLYLGQISRGLEARDLQDSFKGIVSMPRIEAGQDIADISDKLKKTFGTQKAEKPTAVKDLPKEVTITSNDVTDTTTKQVLLDVKAKREEKEKGASFKGSAVLMPADYMLDMKQDPRLPAFHNNTNVDYLTIGRAYGEPEKFFAELGTLVVEMKEELAKSGFYGYERLAPESLFFAGVSIDKQYGGVHIRVPYKALFINPFYDFGARTLFGIRQNQLNTMIHEIAHIATMQHGVAHNTQMIKVEQYLADEGLLDYYNDAILDILRRHESTFTAMKEAYDKSSTQNTSKSLEDYEQGSASASTRGDTDGTGDASSAVSSRAGQGRGKGVSRTQEDDAEQDRSADREDGRPGNFLMNIEKPKKLPPGRTPELAEAAKKLKAGEITKEDFDALVNKFRPVVVYDAPLQPATDDQVFNALDVFKRTKINPPIAAGYPVGLRLDIPAYNRAGVFVVSIHEKRTPSSPGKVIGYSSVAEIKNVTFGLGNQKAALDIAMGKGKDAIQTMEGSFVPTTPAETLRKARAAFQSGDYVQIGIDPTRHAYFFDRANTQPVVYADEILQIGNMILGKGVRYGNKKDYLYNAKPSLAEQEESKPIFDGKKIREEQIKEYAALRAKLARIPKSVAEGEADLSMQRAVARLMQQARDLNVTIKATKPRLDSAEQFLAKAAIEFDKGNISEDVFKVIKAAYDKKPELLEGLRLSVKTPGDGNQAAGQFLSFSRVVRLFKETSGATDPKTIQHELTHSLEQMMTPEQRSVVAQAWVKGLLKAIKNNPDEKHQKYFHAVMDFIDNPSDTTYRKALDLLPSYEMYQFVNPSEFWAVNAQNLMAAELGTAWDKFKRAIARLWEGIKNVLGFDNRYAVQKMFKDVMNGSKERITTDVIADFVNGAGVKSKVLENIEDDKKLLEKYNRPNTPQLDPTPTKTQIVDAGKLSKDFFVSAVSDPLEALGTVANSVDRGIMYARNKNVWFGSGLNAADFAKYNGELLTSQGLATASVALDNAVRGGQIATEVIFQGGIKFDQKSRNFVAVKRDKGMAGVYEAEIALKKRLGAQLGTDVIQGYLEAKRSRSIQSEYFAREAEFEFLESNFKDLQETNAPEEDIMAARDAMVEAKDDLKAIELVYKKVRMSDEEIDEFIARDKVHPELRQIMNNWSAINQNMLAFWKQVGLLSEKRYENLSNIKDYVPWQRIMNDETDVHSPAQTTNRKMTNIGLEKLFKKGVPTVITDVVAKEGQQTFKIQPATVLEVEINGNPVAQDKITATADGQVKLDVPITEGDLVVFKASREIENIIDNMTRNVMRMTMNGLRQAAAQRIVMEYATRDKNGKIMMFPKAERERGRFDFVVNGQRVVVEIQDPLIAESIFGMESLDIAMLAPLAAVANFTRRTITLSGVFQIKQVFKDAPTAALVTGVRHPLLLMGGIYKGFVTSLLNTDPTVQILKSAGIGGFQSAARTPEAEVKRRLGIMNRNVFDFVIKGLDHIGDSSDMAQRVAVYKRVLAETGNETQALYQAANVINFLHHGSGQVAQAVVKTVPFAGAYANSMDVLVQALAGGGLKGRSRANALARLAATGTLLTGITLLYCMLVGDDEEYNQMDDQTKMRNFMIPGTKILLPMNTSAAYFYKAVPEMIYNKIIKEGTKNEVDARRLRTGLKEAAIDMLLGPTPVPSGAKQILEIGLNKDFFTGRPVVPESLGKLEAAERYTTETSEAGKFLSSLTGTKETRLLDPLQADHIIRGIFGTAGAMAQWFTNSIAVASGERAAMTDKQQPITGPFLRADVGRRNEDLFYDFKAEVDKRYGTYAKMLEREDDKQADAYEEKYSDILDFYQEVNKIDSELKEINAEIRYYGESKDTGMTPAQRREEIKLLQLEKQEMLDDIIEMRKDAGL